MPVYEYFCSDCDVKMELVENIKSNPKKKCPKCGKMKLIRLISKGANVIFKGNGWTRTEDYNRHRRTEMEQEVSEKDCSKMTHDMNESKNK